MKIEFSGRFTRASLFRAVMLISRQSGWKNIAWIVFFVIFAGMFIYLAYNAFTEAQANGWEMARLGRHAITLLLLGYLAARPLLGPYQTTNRLWKGGYEILPILGEADGRGVAFGKDGSLDLVPWERYIRIRKAPGLITLLTAEGNLTAFYRDFFKSDNEWRRFEQLVDARVMEAK